MVEESKYEIYCIKNNVNGLKYIGQTAKGIKNRFKQHIDLAISYDSPCLIHKAIREYGAEAFSCELIESAKSRKELDELEIKFIAEHGTLYPGGYNMQIGGGYRKVHGDSATIDPVKMIGDLTRSDLAKLVKVCRANGIQSIKIDGLELTFHQNALFPQKASRRKSNEDKPLEEEKQFTDEEILLWSASGMEGN